MSDKNQPPQTRKISADDGEVIERLLRLAGPRPAVPHERAERVRARVHHQWRHSIEQRPRSSRRLWSWGAVAVAASLLLLVVVGLRPWDFLAPSPPVAATLLKSEGVIKAAGHPMMGTEILAGGVELESGPTGRAAVRLSGGALMRLDHDTSVRVISGAEVEVSRGGIYVDSGPEAEGHESILVKTPLGLITDVGTQFEVRVHDTQVRLRVREGLARLDREGNSHEARRGTQLIVDVEGNVSQEDIPVHGAEWEWTLDLAPQFDLEGKSLAEFLDWVTRETGWQVHITEGSIPEGPAGVILHGSVDDIRPDEAPEAVLPTCGLTHRVEDGVLIVEKADLAVP